MPSPTYEFGTAKISGKNAWLIQSEDMNKNAQEALALDEDGEPVVAHYYQRVNETSFEAIIPTGDSTIPEIGDIFTYDGLKYYVTNVTKRRQNTDFVRYSISVKRFLANNLPANS